MNRYDCDWSGYWTAAPTPFCPDGSLDERALAELMDLYVSQGVHGVLVNGSTGEWFSQSPAERKRVAQVSIEAVAGRIPVVVGITSYTAEEAVEIAHHAETGGADGVLSTPPPYVHPSAEEIVFYFDSLQRAIDLPMMVYNWPRGVAVDMAQMPGLMSRLADLDRVVAIKDSTGDWSAMVDTIETVADRVRVFGSLTHRRGLALMLELGGDGAIDGGGIGAPYAVPFFEAVQARQPELARFWVDKYQDVSGPLINLDYSARFGSPIPQLKVAMALLGQPGGTVRGPLLPIKNPEKLRAIAQILREAGLYVPQNRLEGLVHTPSGQSS